MTAIPELSKNRYALRIRRGLKYINGEVQDPDLMEYPTGNVYFICGLLEGFELRNMETVAELEYIDLQVGGLREYLERLHFSAVSSPFQENGNDDEDFRELPPIPGIPTLILTLPKDEDATEF